MIKVNRKPLRLVFVLTSVLLNFTSTKASTKDDPFSYKRSCSQQLKNHFRADEDLQVAKTKLQKGVSVSREGEAFFKNLAPVIVSRRNSTKKGGQKEVKYYRTNRGHEEITLYYPENKVPYKSLGNSIVLDVGMGEGKFVDDLRLYDIEAYGLDIALSPRQLKNIYKGPKSFNGDGIILSQKLGEGYFIEADALNTGLASNQVDVIFSTYSIVTFDLLDIDGDDNLEFIENVLKEFKRILKIGGVIKIFPIFEGVTDTKLNHLIQTIDGLEVSNLGKYKSNYMYIEIIRTH